MWKCRGDREVSINITSSPKGVSDDHGMRESKDVKRLQRLKGENAKLKLELKGMKQQLMHNVHKWKEDHKVRKELRAELSLDKERINEWME